MSKKWKNIPEIYHQRKDTYLCSNFLEVMFYLIIIVRNGVYWKSLPLISTYIISNYILGFESATTSRVYRKT